MSDDATPAVDPGTPADGVHCRSCAYDLRGLEPTSACPECGTPVARSLAGHQLSASDPAWVARLSRGLWLDAAGVAVSVLLLIPPL